MTQNFLAPPALLALGLACAVSACDRGAGSGGDSTRNIGNTAVQATSPGAAASTPLPVSPSGVTNPSTAGTGNDLSNSTRASGRSNVYQPPSSDNPPPGGMAAADGASSAASQTVSSQTRGTSPPPNDGTLPKGTEGNTGSRRGGGKG